MFINELKNIFITFVAATAVINGSMTLGMMMAAQYIIGQLNAPIHDFVGFIRELQDARISLDRIGEVQLLENEDTPKFSSGEGYRVRSIPPSPFGEGQGVRAFSF